MSSIEREFLYLELNHPELKEHQLLTRKVLHRQVPVSVAMNVAGERRLLLPIDDQVIPVWTTFGLMLRATEWWGDGRSQRQLELTCRSPQLETVFNQLAEDLIERLESDETGNTYATTLTVLGEWERLFARERPCLSVNEQAGLFAELDLLGWLGDVSPVSALNCWSACHPGLGLRDFSGSRKLIEVKAVTARSGGTITVHGLDQLDPATEGLHLRVARIEESAGGTTLRGKLFELIDRGFPPTQLIQSAAQRGYVVPSHDEDERRFDVIERLTWILTPDMPLLGRDDLAENKRTAITGIDYSLPIGALGNSTMGSTALDTLRRTMTGGASLV